MHINIRNNLLKLCRKHGFRQIDLAEQIGTSKQTFNKWVKNRDQPTIGYVVRIHKVTGWTLEEMFEEE